jgi:hypothetical protein
MAGVHSGIGHTFAVCDNTGGAVGVRDEDRNDRLRAVAVCKGAPRERDVPRAQVGGGDGGGERGDRGGDGETHVEVFWMGWLLIGS